MKAEQIQNMPVGLELDRLITVHVLGMSGEGLIENYSCNLFGAWTVVDAMKVKGYGLLLHCPGSSTYCDGCRKFECYYARFEENKDRCSSDFGQYQSFEAETAWEAICKAALLTTLDSHDLLDRS